MSSLFRLGEAGLRRRAVCRSRFKDEGDFRSPRVYRDPPSGAPNERKKLRALYQGGLSRLLEGAILNRCAGAFRF
jgi:hypothetical protein